LDIHTLVPSTANAIVITNSQLPDPDNVLFQATICTTQNETTDAPIMASQPVRHNSPISTITDKLNNAIGHLNDLKNIQRRIKKEYKSTVASLRSEIEGLHFRLEAPDKGTERAQLGNLALKHQIRQIDDKIRGLDDNIAHTKQCISDRQTQLGATRKKRESERSALENNRRSQTDSKSYHDKVLQQFHGEKLAINAQKEKLTSREVKLKGELAILEVAEKKRTEKSDARSRKREEARNQLIKGRQASQAEQILALEQLESGLAEMKERTARTQVERLALETALRLVGSEGDVASGAILLGGPDGQVKGNDSPERSQSSPTGNRVESKQ
jgi:chromosome segregation ATPase